MVLHVSCPTGFHPAYAEIPDRSKIGEIAISNRNRSNHGEHIIHHQRIGSSKKIDMDIGQIVEITTKRYNFKIDLRNYCPSELEQGFELLSRILETLPQDSSYNERLVVAVEFLDRLIDEQVDLEYYLPFLQYLIAMENYTITEFLNEEFDKQLHNLKGTHGDWIESLSKNNLDGKRLTNFFKITGVRREGLELLVDLLFVKIIAIY